MTRHLTPDTRLETLRKEAKRWLKALRAQNQTARDRFNHAYADASQQPSLRDVQHALAREHGLADWVALKAAVAEAALAGRGREERLAEFLEHARLRYGIRPGTGKWEETYSDDPGRWSYAARILERHPQIVAGNIHAAAVSGDLEEVRRILRERPAAALERATLDGAQPLDYVCYGRLPIPVARDNGVAIAAALLDAGAPFEHAVAADDGAEFQPLTAAIGDGEAGQPPHPQAEQLATLLIDRGADPYSSQALYNTALHTDDAFWLDFLHERSVRRGDAHKWTMPSKAWPKSPMVDFLLIMAVHANHLVRARWALARGADPRCRHPYYSRGNLHTHATVNGNDEMAALLLEFGAVADRLTVQESFQAACIRLDRAAAARLAREHPQCLRDPAPMLLAATRDLKDMARLLLDLGMSPDIADHTRYSALHAAAGHDSVEVGQLLIERGAQIDPLDTRFQSPPLGWATYRRQRRMMAMLGTVSRHVRALCWTGNVARLRELFAQDSALARTVYERGTLFFELPDDEDVAHQIAELLLAHGADPGLRNPDGKTAAQNAEDEGLDSVADLLSEFHAR